MSALPCTQPGARDTMVTKRATVLLLQGRWLEGKTGNHFGPSSGLSFLTHSLSSSRGIFPPCLAAIPGDHAGPMSSLPSFPGHLLAHRGWEASWGA